MSKNNFNQRKKDILSKIDKSSKKKWDKKIIPLCEKINSSENYYTTSSCSGRVVLMLDKNKKAKDLFIKIYHDMVSFRELKKDLDNIHSLIITRSQIDGSEQTSPCSSLKKLLTDNKLKQRIVSKGRFEALIKVRAKRGQTIKFKQEPCILHAACRSLEDAQKLLDKAKLAGWKKSGIIASKNRFVVELNSTEKLEFPIIKNSKILVDGGFLKILVKKSNENLKKSWEKIGKLRELM